MFSQDECQIHVEYNPCLTEEDFAFVCDVMNADGSYHDCRTDFETHAFWEQFREEAFWTSPESEPYADFYAYWDEQHGFSGDSWETDERCEWKNVEVSCQDFEFSQEDTCYVMLSYSPCVTDQFFCDITEMNDYGEFEQDSCTSDFEDPEFWMIMRQEQWWFREENAEFFDLYTFWEVYHGYNGDVQDCDWKELHANCWDFQMLSEEECHIQVSYSPCQTEFFVCRSTDVNGEVSNCDDDFTDVMFWSNMREEMWWQQDVNQQY